jgi:tight adherence protein B
MLVLTAVAVLAAPASAQSLKASLAGGVAFPDRTLLLSVPPGPSLTASRVHVTENGRAVSNVTVTSLRQANAGDFGVVLVIDSDPSMAGAPLAHAMAAARALAAQRTGMQALGVIFGDGTTLPLTSDPGAIQHALANAPRIVPKTNLLSSMEVAINELAGAHIADGAVIFVSDDIDRDPTYTPQLVGSLAAASHVRIFTVGVRDPAFARRNPGDLPPQSMGLLATAGGGFYTEAAPSQLTSIFTAIESGLTSEYVAHYRSSQAFGHRIELTVRVDGVTGTFTTTYSSPAAPVQVARRAPSHRHSFWTSSLALVVVAVGGALLLGLAVLLLLSQFASNRSVSARVGDFVSEPEGAVGVRPAWSAASTLQRTGGMLASRPWWPGFVEEVGIARLGRSAVELVYLAAIGSFVLAALVILTTGSALAGIPALAAGPIGLRAVVNQRVRQQRALFAEQLPSHLEEVAGAIRSGRSVVEALTVVSEDAEEPTRSEFDKALADERLGLPLDETLRPIALRMQADGMEQFAVVAAMHRRTGSSVAEVIDQIAVGARERDELRRELRALTAQGRLARWILTAMPPVMLLAFTIIDSSYERPMFHTTGGLVALGIGTVLVLAGSLVMKRIVDIEV